MERDSIIPAKVALEWADDLAKFRPERPGPEVAGSAATILSFNTGAGVDGLYLRMRTKGGTTFDIFLNAALATQLTDVGRQIGQAAGWMNAEGELKVLDPENLRYDGLKS